jgi:hypothetical protein
VSYADIAGMTKLIACLAAGVLLLPATAEAKTLSLKAAKKATRSLAYNDMDAMELNGLHASLFAGPVCKRIAHKAARCGYRLQYIDEGLLILADRHALVTLSYGYVRAERISGRDHSYLQGVERIPPLRP